MITSLKENKGDHKILTQEDVGFKTFIKSCNLVDVETTNGIFTWNNRSWRCNQIASHLDCFLVTEDLLESKANISASFLPAIGSDHWTISFIWDNDKTPLPRLFHFTKF